MTDRPSASDRAAAADPEARDVALTVAGSDSGGGAGVQADLKTMAALGVFGTSAVTSVTAQNTCGVDAVDDVSTDVVAAQIRAVTDDFAVGAAKTGMLSSADIIETVASALDGAAFPLVVDPVMVAQSGDRLLAADAEASLRDDLLPLAALATPNLPEAAALAEMTVDDEDDMRAAAARIAGDDGETGPAAVLVTGGHLGDGDAVDVLYADGDTRVFRNRRFDTDATHGSGCTLSSAIAAGLARGDDLSAAVARAEAFVARAVRYGLDVGDGPGPVHHLAAARNDAAGTDAVRAVDEVVRALEAAGVDALVPEVGLNVAVATPYAVGTDDVAAVDGRIHRTVDGVAAAGPARLGASSHVARLLLAVREYDPAVTAAANVRLDDDVAAAVTERFDAVEVDRTAEPDASPTERRDGGTMSWTVDRAMTGRDDAPDAVFDRGAVGKEPMCRVFAETPAALRDRLVDLGGRL
ncbi:bifunctional hydroxymethylpyrimidine kinase/phosphomethylpyrimidine kinase [Halobaculum sp. D14]|uniref:bifunctional hydroxymethylpyrimidine kinase/phosphomethylpyrimidine kinase n=1 Tax=Halobaculum sp. D14 TaxID=3421642 RepID=UPI003EB9E4F0